MSKTESDGYDTVAIVSGGMDSTVLVYHLMNLDYKPHLLSFNYGQRHKKELEYARATAHDLSLKHDIVDLTSITHLISSSALTDNGQPVPEGHYADDNMKQTVVPNRNMIMLSIAAGVAVSNKYAFVALGVHAGDHAVYPDCRPIFVRDMEYAIMSGNEGFMVAGGIGVNAPFIDMTKTEIATLGEQLGVEFEKTWSCYNGRAFHCGKCGTCVERKEAFHDAGIDDPTIYEGDRG